MAHNLNIRKRTKQIDAAREVLLKNGFHSTVGDLTVQPLHKEQAASNIRATARMGLVKRMVEVVQQQGANFFEACVGELLPRRLVGKDLKQIESWLCTEGIIFKQDGLTSVLLRQGVVIASQTAQVDGKYVIEVLAELQRQQEAA